jgi:hypothetical protein
MPVYLIIPAYVLKFINTTALMSANIRRLPVRSLRSMVNKERLYRIKEARQRAMEQIIISSKKIIQRGVILNLLNIKFNILSLIYVYLQT